MQTTFCILSLGMGVESTAILVRWLTETATRPLTGSRRSFGPVLVRES